jgi:class 3 adenylate cyclase
LFTDIEDSTKLAEQLGDERWMELLRWHRDDVQKAASRHRGFVVKSLGDGFMIAFASASEAIRCAGEVRDRAAAGWEDYQFRVRAGIHSGDVIRDLDDFYGHAVIVAARVAGAAPGGDILATGVVRELVRGGGFRFSEPRNQLLKGIDREVEVVTLLPSR